ncbi:MAG: hypothetical protein HRU38_20880 [Saccharospirillaceae bacterium]|nr:hypothetical protein [Pseudomonadales bacterium]NRB81087.1 hypothetical protein [Saccharospirillaceae bacterium]
MDHWLRLGINENSDIKTINRAFKNKKSEFSKNRYPGIYKECEEAYHKCMASQQPVVLNKTKQITTKKLVIKSKNIQINEKKSNGLSSGIFSFIIISALIAFFKHTFS